MITLQHTLQHSETQRYEALGFKKMFSISEKPQWLVVVVGKALSVSIRISLHYTWTNLFNADVSRAVNSLPAERTTRPSLMASSLLGASIFRGKTGS